MSFPLPNEILQSPHIAFKQIMQEVQNHQNGDVSRQMQARGLTYKLNYGVAAPLLKKIASAYKQDNALATQLFNCKIREGLLLSSFLFEPLNITTDKAVQLGAEIDNMELTEQFSLNLFGYLPNLHEVIDGLMVGDTNQQQLAFYSMSWGLKRKTLLEDYYVTAFQKIEDAVEKDNGSIVRGINMAMQSLLTVDDKSREKTFALAERMQQSTDDGISRTGEEFLWLHRD